MTGRQPSRILVIQTAFLGDVVLTTPLFRALKRLFPTASLSALVTPQSAPLVEEDPHLSQVLTYDKKGGEPFWSAWGKVRGGGFDALVAAHRSHRTSLLALGSGVPVRVGFADAGFAWAYNRKVWRPLDLHEVDRNLRLLSGFGRDPKPGDRVLHVGYTEAEAREVATVLGESSVAAAEQVATLCPGSVWATKRWLPDGFAFVGRGLLARGYRPILVGSPEDREVSEEVARNIGPTSVNAAGRTTLKALAAWMDRSSVLITNDSAPLHVAAARGTPAVAVFGATTQGLGFAPSQERARVVEVDLDCRPCGLHGGKSCPQEHFRCMEDVSAEAVLRAAVELLDGDRGR